MSTADSRPETPTLPNYMLDPNAVLKDDISSWRYGRAPDYTKTRETYAQSRSQNHTAGSLPNLVENLVKNWEVEASFKKDINDWRTIDKEAYQFSVNGGPAQTAEHVLKVGTYNALITPNDYYDPEHSDFNSSHKTFKRMMPTFAWEVIEVYSAPPVVSFKWRHWGVMKNDYIGFNHLGEKVTARAHGGTIDFLGITIAHLNENHQITSLETFFDPLQMFRQIAGVNGVQKVKVGRLGKYTLLPGEDPMSHLHGMDDINEGEEEHHVSPPIAPEVPEVQKVDIQAGSRPISRAESHMSHDTVTPEEMARMGPADCPFLMKWRSMSMSGPTSEVGYDEPAQNTEDIWSSATVVETTVVEVTAD